MMNFYKSLNDLSLREMAAIADELYDLKAVTVKTADATLVFSWDVEKWEITCENEDTDEIFVFSDVELDGEVAHSVVRACYYSTDSL